MCSRLTMNRLITHLAANMAASSLLSYPSGGPSVLTESKNYGVLMPMAGY